MTAEKGTTHDVRGTPCRIKAVSVRPPGQARSQCQGPQPMPGPAANARGGVRRRAGCAVAGGSTRDGEVAELAVLVIAPAPDRALGEGAGVGAADGEGGGALDAGDGGEPGAVEAGDG